MNDIPIKNIYYMILYAWNKVKDISNISEKNLEGLNDTNDVIIELFLSEVSKITKRGISRDYIKIMEKSSYIKGKVDLVESIKVLRPDLICHFDEYRDDIIINQVIKSLLLRIIRIIDVTNQHKKKARRLLAYLNNVNEIILEDALFNKITFNRLNQEYKFAIDLGTLIYKNSIPREEDGNYKFIEIMDDEEQLSSIFEEFLRKFYDIHSNYSVSRRYYNFDWEPIMNSNIDLLPRMETDIELVCEKKKIIMDAKYYKNAFTSKYEAKKFISNNIYQMKAYLTQNMNKYEILRGIIIYPSNGYEINERYYSKRGYSIEFMTINLDMEWEKIEVRLLDIIKLG